MLNSLYIKNYRILKEFKLDSVNQINLITGENNTGKSTVLEAIALYAGKGDKNYIFQLLEKRGEYSKQDTQAVIELNIKLLSVLFTDKIFSVNPENSIEIEDRVSGKFIRLKFVRYVNDFKQQGNTIITKRILSDDETVDSYKIGFQIDCDNNFGVFFEENFVANKHTVNYVNPDKIQFVDTNLFDKETNGKLFDNIALTNKENYVIEALKIIEPKTERIAFISDKNSNIRRNPVIKLSDKQEVLPLQSMGDGMNRILTIILALVNVENGYLLIDEFENGLNYRVQQKLWEIIFKLAKQLNVQVFATTHSNDCIAGFEQALNSSENTVKGKFIRLDNIKGVIKPMEYSPKELQTANAHQIETR